MGFRTGAYAKVWEATPMSNSCTKLRMSISRKNKQTGEYEQDFSGFILAIGAATAQKALELREGTTIKIGDVDVSTKYNKEKKTTYTDFKMFNFEVERMPDRGVDVEPPDDFGEEEDGGGASRLPF